MVSFGRPFTILYIRNLATRKISDILVGIGDLLRREISKIKFKPWGFYFTGYNNLSHILLGAFSLEGTSRNLYSIK